MLEQLDTVRFDSGALALDFLNTRRVVKGRVQDGLNTPKQLGRWLTESAEGPTGATTSAASPPAARLLLSEGTRLREEVERALHALTSGRPLPLSSLHTINRVLDASRISVQLESQDGHSELVQHETGGELITALAPIAISAADLLTHANPNRIRQCAADSCVLWFLDSSKNGRRRWCSMARCGNRAKVKKHWDKQKASEAVGRIAVDAPTDGDA